MDKLARLRARTTESLKEATSVRWKDHLEGGKADDKTPADFERKSLEDGQKHEKEHTKSPTVAKEIAMDHLTEDPKYYEKLEKVEKKAFTTSEYSGPLNPVIESGASYQGRGPINSLRAPIARPKVAFKLQGETDHQGLDIAIENRKGSVRKGVDKDGKPWRTVMKHPYGYIKGTKGADGEEIDCYVGPKKDATHAFVVHQHKDTGKGYDEDKVMLGFGSKEEAEKAYLKHYNDPKFLGPVKEVLMERFKKLVSTGKKLVKISAGAPTRGGFMMASDIPPMKVPGLRTAIEKNSDMLPDYVTFGPSDFKKSKYADVSPTRPLGDGGGNPHRMESDIPPFRQPSLAAPLRKLADGDGFDAAAAYYNYGTGGSPGRGPVNEAGFRQSSYLASIPVNSLRAPLVKRATAAAPGAAAAAAKRVGTAPGSLGKKGPSIAQVSKPIGFGSPIAGALKPNQGVGGFRPNFVQ